MDNKSNNENMQKRQQRIPNNRMIPGDVNNVNVSGSSDVQVAVGSGAKNVKISRPAASYSSQSQATSFEVFFSYVEEDRESMGNLQAHLVQLVKENVITNWYSSRLAAGSDSTESMKHFNQASVILLLISPDYIASDLHYKEVGRAMERRAKEGITVIPVLIRPIEGLEYTQLSGLQSIPRSGKPISQSRNREAIFSEVAKEIREVIGGMK